jgi:hypothetical protein
MGKVIYILKRINSFITTSTNIQFYSFNYSSEVTNLKFFRVVAVKIHDFLKFWQFYL